MVIDVAIGIAWLWFPDKSHLECFPTEVTHKISMTSRIRQRSYDYIDYLQFGRFLQKPLGCDQVRLSNKNFVRRIKTTFVQGHLEEEAHFD